MLNWAVWIQGAMIFTSWIQAMWKINWLSNFRLWMCLSIKRWNIRFEDENFLCLIWKLSIQWFIIRAEIFIVSSPKWNDQYQINIYLNILGIVVKYKLSNDYFTDRLSSKQRWNIINCEKKIRAIVTHKNFSLSINTKIHCPLLMSCYARHTVYDTFHSFQSINYNRHLSIHFHHSSTRPNILEHYHIQRSSKWTKANVIQILNFNLTKGENLTASEQNERHKHKYRLYSSATKDTVEK